MKYLLVPCPLYPRTPLTRSTVGSSYENWKNTSRWSHTLTSRLEGFWPPESPRRRIKLMLGSRVPWSKRYALPLRGYGSLLAVTPFPCVPQSWLLQATMLAAQAPSHQFLGILNQLRVQLLILLSRVCCPIRPLQYAIQTPSLTPGFTKLTKTLEAFQRLRVCPSTPGCQDR